jgi:hypothetical protein
MQHSSSPSEAVNALIQLEMSPTPSTFARSVQLTLWGPDQKGLFWSAWPRNNTTTNYTWEQDLYHRDGAGTEYNGTSSASSSSPSSPHILLRTGPQLRRKDAIETCYACSTTCQFCLVHALNWRTRWFPLVRTLQTDRFLELSFIY